MSELEKWFDEKYCDISGGIVVIGNESQQKLAHIARAASSPRIQKTEWLRREGNEAWYGQRLALVLATWGFLEARHCAITSALEKENEKSDAALTEANAKIQTLELDLAAVREHGRDVKREGAQLMAKVVKIKSLKRSAMQFLRMLDIG